MSRSISVLAAALALVLAACSGEEEAEVCIEERVTIAQGVYGFVLTSSDTSPETSPAVGDPVEVLDGPDGALVATTRTDADGIYQLELPVGDYAFCKAAALGCEEFTIERDSRVRIDHHRGFGTVYIPMGRSPCADR